MRGRYLSLAFGVLALFLVNSAKGEDKKPDAAAKAKALLVGKWEGVGTKKKVIFEFLKDGKMKFTMGKDAFDGNYSVIDGEKMEVEVIPPGAKSGFKHKLKFKVSKEELVTIDEKKKEDKFKRIK